MTSSRWVAQFETHRFQSNWSILKNLLAETKVDDESVPTVVQELVRIKRVVAYLDSVILKMDQELVPRQIWENFATQLEPCLANIQAYIKNKNAGHLTQANDHADNLLSYVRPYMVAPPEAMQALRNSAQIFGTELYEILNAFTEKSKDILGELNLRRQEATSDASSIRKSKGRVDEFVKVLIDGHDGVPSAREKVELALEKVIFQSGSIDDFHKTLIGADGSEESIRAQVNKSAVEVANNLEATRTALAAIKDKISQLDNFYIRIFGEHDQDSGSQDKKKSGLNAELEDRLEQLTKVEEAHKQKHEALIREIETLLPGATSAGLATAYNKMRVSFDDPIKLYTKLFYGSLGLLVIASMYTSIQAISINPFSVSIINVAEWDAVLKSLMFKAPFAAPVIWLAIFSSKRRSQYERLQQEYAHKEAIAKSYESYRKQLQALREDTELLQRELIAKAIDAISFNPSATLDGKHEGKPPLLEAVSKLGEEELVKLLKAAVSAKQ